ncbi:MAG: DNA repair protein RecO [Planctomycetota bacterium]|jgi:DNA repair protein RecO (recombination protein O)
MQIRVTDQPAFILHRRDWQNSSLMLEVLTRDYGRVNLLAKGGKNSRSPGLFQPFSRVTVSWLGRQELKTLTGIDGTLSEFDESLFLPLLYINELVAAFLPIFDASTEIYSLYDELLSKIEVINFEICLRQFERSTMQVLGYLPDTFVDADSGKPIDAECSYQFQVNRGFICCESDSKNAIEGRHIILWNQGDYGEPPVAHLAKAIMRVIIDFNLQGKRLKSRDVYLQIRNWA